MKRNIAVFFGGKSFEHDVSIITGIQIANNLNVFKYNIFPIYIAKNGNWFYGQDLLKIESYKNFDVRKFKQVFLKPEDSCLYTGKIINKKICEIDCAVLGNHGGNGEDGTLSSILTSSRIPFTASGMAASVLTMDKCLTKAVLKAEGLNSLPYAIIRRGENFDLTILPEFPVIIKPAKLGSSIGIKFVKSAEEFEASLEEAFLLDDIVLIEKGLTDFYELNIAIYKNGDNYELSEIEKPLKQSEVLTFENKYIGSSNGMQNLSREFPAVISPELNEEVIQLAQKAFIAFGLTGICRIDFMVNNEDGNLYINELNSIPGSLAFYLFKKKFTFSMLLDDLIENAKLNALITSRKTFSFESSILSNFEKNLGSKKQPLK